MTHRSETHPESRQARLRLEAGYLYPGIGAEVWIPADEMTDLVETQRLLHGQSPARSGERVLDPGHFDFRGEDEGRRETTNRRCTDPY